MPRVDFHTNVADKLAYACRLVRKAYGAQAKVVLLAEDQAQADALDQALWTFSATDFLPHALAADPLAVRSPIVVAAADSDALPHTDMLVNLTREVPAFADRFNRIFEIVGAGEEDAAAGRRRYASYKQQAYPLTHFVAGQS